MTVLWIVSHGGGPLVELHVNESSTLEMFLFLGSIFMRVFIDVAPSGSFFTRH